METARAKLMSLALKFGEDYKEMKRLGNSPAAFQAFENYQYALNVALEGTPSTCEAVLQAIKDASPELLPN